MTLKEIYKEVDRICVLYSRDAAIQKDHDLAKTSQEIAAAFRDFKRWLENDGRDE